MRSVAADLRRDTLAGLGSAERERFVDTLLAIKANLQRGPASAVADSPAGAESGRRGR
ncbi:hypothetical protein D3C83_243700 [compost metagenome]